MIIKCPHYKGDGYGYEVQIGRRLIRFLFCYDCNMQLSAEMLKQFIIQTYCAKQVEQKT